MAVLGVVTPRFIYFVLGFFLVFNVLNDVWDYSVGEVSMIDWSWGSRLFVSGGILFLLFSAIVMFDIARRVG